MRPDVIFIIGPQGSGKGTQAKLLAERLGFFYWEMGTILREERDRKFPDGQTVGEIIDKGILLSDEKLLAVAEERFGRIAPDQGVIFDGIPRRIGQAEAVMKFLREQGRTSFLTLFINLPREESKNRLLKRAELQKREDDTPEGIENRLRYYEEATVPVLDYLKQHTQFIEIDGRPSIPEVTKQINARIEPHPLG